MKFCRFVPLVTDGEKPARSAYGTHDGDAIREIAGEPWGKWSEGSTLWAAKDVRLLAPVAPSKIVGIGRNYAAHAAEMGNEVPKEPMMFLKPPSSIVGPDEPIVLTKYSNKVEHEGELGLVIGKTCAHLSDEEDPLAYVMGYVCVNDVSARDLQKSDVQFARAKGFDSFCPVGPIIETELDPRDVLVETRVNGALRQTGRTSLMIYPAAFLVRWISRMMTLLPGDLIATGTPAGVGPLAAGDEVEVSVDGVGVLRNPVQAPRE